MATSFPKYLPGQDPTVHARDAITGARFVKLADAVSQHADGHAQVTPCGAGEFGIGVAATDAADETKLLVFCEGVVEVTAGEAIQHGDLIASGDLGVAVIANDAGQFVLGVAWADAAEDAKCLVKLLPGGARRLAATEVVGDLAAVPDLTNNTAAAGDDVVENVPAIAAAAATAVTDAMLTDATVDAAGVNNQLALLAADIIAKTQVPLTAVENDIADLTDKVNVVLARLRAAGLLTV